MSRDSYAWHVQALRYDNHAFNSKYCLCQMLRDKVESVLGKSVQAAQTNRELRSFSLAHAHTHTLALIHRYTVVCFPVKRTVLRTCSTRRRHSWRLAATPC